MASTVTAVIAKFRRRYPDCSTVRATELFMDAHKELCNYSEVRNTTVTVTLDGTSREFTLAEGVVRIHEAYYERSSDPSDWLPILETSKSSLIVNRHGWRAGDSTGEPTQYYISSAVDSDTAKKVIGFDPIPETPTSGTYPRVVLYVTSHADLSGAETVPTSVTNDNVYVWRMFYFWATEMRLNEASYWEKVSEKELGKTIQRIQNVQANPSDQMVPSFVDGFTPVV